MHTSVFHAGKELPQLQPHWALFLDVDGTLAEIAPTPDAARIPAEVLEAMDAIRLQLSGAVALVSGRSIAGIDALCEPYRFAAAGQHGLELRLPDGNIVRAAERSELMQRTEERVAAFHRQHPSLLVEYKGLSVAVHFREVPELGQTVRWYLESLATAAPELCLQDGKMVCELRLRCADKGTAIEALLRDPQFAGRTPVFIGDDLTDEDGFRAVNARGGISVKVGGGATFAGWQVRSVSELHAWLRSAIHMTVRKSYA